jgi:hypothetical protein
MYKINTQELTVVRIDAHGEHHDMNATGEPCETLWDVVDLVEQLLDEGAFGRDVADALVASLEGEQVEGLRDGEDYDTGTLHQIREGDGLVAWSDGLVAWSPLSTLRPRNERIAEKDTGQYLVVAEKDTGQYLVVVYEGVDGDYWLGVTYQGLWAGGSEVSLDGPVEEYIDRHAATDTLTEARKLARKWLRTIGDADVVEWLELAGVGKYG